MQSVCLKYIACTRNECGYNDEQLADVGNKKYSVSYALIQKAGIAAIIISRQV